MSLALLRIQAIDANSKRGNKQLLYVELLLIWKWKVHSTFKSYLKAKESEEKREPPHNDTGIIGVTRRLSGGKMSSVTILLWRMLLLCVCVCVCVRASWRMRAGREPPSTSASCLWSRVSSTSGSIKSVSVASTCVSHTSPNPSLRAEQSRGRPPGPLSSKWRKHCPKHTHPNSPNSASANRPCPSKVSDQSRLVCVLMDVMWFWFVLVSFREALGAKRRS